MLVLSKLTFNLQTITIDGKGTLIEILCIFLYFEWGRYVSQKSLIFTPTISTIRYI